MRFAPGEHHGFLTFIFAAIFEILIPEKYQISCGAIAGAGAGPWGVSTCEAKLISMSWEVFLLAPLISVKFPLARTGSFWYPGSGSMN